MVRVISVQMMSGRAKTVVVFAGGSLPCLWRGLRLRVCQALVSSGCRSARARCLKTHGAGAMCQARHAKTCNKAISSRFSRSSCRTRFSSAAWFERFASSSAPRRDLGNPSHMILCCDTFVTEGQGQVLSAETFFWMRSRNTTLKDLTSSSARAPVSRGLEHAS